MIAHRNRIYLQYNLILLAIDARPIFDFLSILVSTLINSYSLKVLISHEAWLGKRISAPLLDLTSYNTRIDKL
jgi:hypothetical protein